MNKTNKKIAEQSKKALTNALLRTIEIYDFKEITVTQIAQEAGLSRKTFYRLFTDKNQILGELFQKLTNEYLSDLKKIEIHSYWDVARFYFNFFEKKKDLLKLFAKNNLLFLFHDACYKHSFNVFEEIHSEAMLSDIPHNLNYVLAYSMGGLFNMLIEWIKNDTDIPAETFINELKNIFKQFAS